VFKKGYKQSKQTILKRTLTLTGQKRVKREVRICPNCEKRFEKRVTSKQECCCKNCANRLKTGKSNVKLKLRRETRQCACGCGEKFECTVTSKKRFVSGHNTQKGFRILREIRVCICGCGKNFEVSINDPKKYFSRQCQHKTLVGRKLSKKTKLKQRQAAIRRIKENNGICWPSYNKKACEFFKSYDEKNNTKGHYAVYGGGEYHIKELGYFPDYINFEKKIIIEWDEKYHKYRKEKDKQRQKEIQEFYPDFKFLRYKEEGINTAVQRKG